MEPWVPSEQLSYAPEAINGVVPLEDRWMFSRMAACSEQMNKAFETYRFHEAAQTIWSFIWHEFCDWYVELKKLRFVDGSGLNAHWRNILTVFECSLRMLHPVMPFLTEELWQRLVAGHGRKISVSVSLYPLINGSVRDLEAEQQMTMLQELISTARNLRADGKLDPKEPLDATLYSAGAAATLAVAQQEAIERLANVKLTVAGIDVARAQGPLRSTPEFDLVLAVPAGKLDALKLRLEKEITDLDKVIANSERQLSNEDFLKKAPEKVLEGMRGKLADYKAQREKSQLALAGLAG